MKKLVGVIIMVTMFVLTVPSAFSFEPEKGVYAKYEIYKDPDIPETAVFALLKNPSSPIKYLNLEDVVYKYQILDIKDNIATVRICFEGKINTGINDETGRSIIIPFKRIFDIKLDLDTLEMIDENGKAWGKWLFWVKMGSYDWKEYPFMKNWNDHGEVKGWLTGPLKKRELSLYTKSPLTKEITHYFRLSSYSKPSKTMEYLRFEDYGIESVYRAYKTEEGTVREEIGGYYLKGSSGITLDTRETIELVLIEYNYTDEGLFFETMPSFYIDDFLDQKLGITLLQMNSLMITDYDTSDKIIIEGPIPEYQKPSFEDEVKRIEQLIEQYAEYNPQWVEFLQGTEIPSETPITETPEKTESPQKSEEKSETQLPTTTQSNNTEKTNMLYYVAPLFIVMIIAVFIVFKEKR